MSNITITEAVNFYEKAYKDNWGYVWGANGKKYTEEEAARLYNIYKSATYNKKYYMTTQIARWKGHYVSDCSGLNEALCGLNMTADSYYNKCTTKGLIATIPSEPGILVFKDNGGKKVHIGMTVGAGMVIENRSSATGVCKRKLSAAGWTHWGIPSYIERTYADPEGITCITKNSDVIVICWLQYKLNLCLAGVDGFTPLDIDGVYGQITKDAVILYFKQLGWTPNSGATIGNGTITALKANRKK